MASLNFPSSPTNGQKYSLNGVTYYWDSTIGAWLTSAVQKPYDTSADTQVIFNDNATANGSYGLTFAKTSNTLSIVNMTVSGNAYFANTTAIKIPVGTTSDRPTAVAGMIRYNSTLGKFEGYSSAWGTIGGGAVGGSSDEVFYENYSNVSYDYTISTGKNAMSAGPITINTGVTITVPANSTWTVV